MKARSLKWVVQQTKWMNTCKLRLSSWTWTSNQKCTKNKMKTKTEDSSIRSITLPSLWKKDSIKLRPKEMKDVRNFLISNRKHLVFWKISNLISKSQPPTLAALSILFFLTLRSLKTLQKNTFVYIIRGQTLTLLRITKMELSLIQKD